MQPHEFQTQMNRLSASLMKPSITEKNMDILFAEVKSMDSEIFKNAVEIMMKEGDRNFMPKLTELYKHYNMAKATLAGQKFSENGVPTIPDHILNMTDEEVDADYKLMSGFLQAYPYPDYPVGATGEECKQIDHGYNSRMRRSRINPDEITNPKVAVKLMADLRKAMPQYIPMGGNENE